MSNQVLDLNKLCFPEDKNGKHGPLPKQAEFMRVALDLSLNAPRYIRYCGGVGSGKTLIGCATVLSWALIYPGDYLVGRQYMPELSITTYKTFLEICPPELILENRIADKIVKVRSSNNKVSTVIFRGLDEYDKLRSLNLNGAYIDESSQTTEEAFTLLQGRLRGKHVRKIILTTNSGGRDWGWKLFVDKGVFTTEQAKNMFYSIKAPSTENTHLPEGYVESMMSTWSEERIKREILADEDAFEGQVYTEFNRSIHVVKPFRIPDHWQRHIRMDHGLRNPAAALFFAIGPEGEVYLYKEFYEQEWLVNEIVLGKRMNATHFPGIRDLAKVPGDASRYEKFVTAKIDPSTKIRSGKDGTSTYDEYFRHWPKELPMLGFAKNDVNLGIDRVKSYLKVNPKTGKPLLFIFDNCKNTLDEISTYRWQELKPGQSDSKSEHEKPVKVHDHAMDALRYMIVDLPDPSKVQEIKEKFKYKTLEGSLNREIKSIRSPKPKDPFGGL